MIYILLGLFIVLQLADGYTSNILLRRANVRERNILLNLAIDRFGVKTTLIVAKGFAILCGILLAYLDTGWISLLCLAVLCLFYTWVVYNNVRLMK